MKKTIYALLIFYQIISLYSQEEQKKNLTMSPFTGIKVYSNIDVNLISSDVNKAIVYGHNSDYVVLSSKDKILKIRVSGGKILTPGRTKIDLYYNSPLGYIGAYQGSKINSHFPIKQTTLSIESKGSSSINIEAYCKKLNTKISFGGKAFIKGKVIDHELFYAYSGICESEKLITEKTKSKSNGGAYAYIFANELLEAQLYGGVLRVFGKPKKIMKKERFGAKITIEK